MLDDFLQPIALVRRSGCVYEVGRGVHSGLSLTGFFLPLLLLLFWGFFPPPCGFALCDWLDIRFLLQTLWIWGSFVRFIEEGA